MRLLAGILRYEFIFAAPLEPCEKRKYFSVTSYSGAKNIHYASSILVKIIDLIQLFFHMLTRKALV